MNFWLVVMCVGFAFEVAGLGVAVWGFWRTWRDNAQGRAFLPLRVRHVLNWIKVKILRRRPRPVHGSVNATAGLAFSGSAFGYVSSPFRDGMAIDEKVQVAQGNALKALSDASKAHAAVESERQKRKKALRELEDRMSGTEKSIADFATGLVVEGIPVAILGLALAVVGLGLQAVASIVTFSA